MRALIELKKECMKRISFGEKCFVCYEKNIKLLVLHHKRYNKNSVTYNQFENSDDGRLKYYANLLDEIKEDPENFLCLCIDCHNILEFYLGGKDSKARLRELSDRYPENDRVRAMYVAYNITMEKRALLAQFFWS